MWRAQVEAWRRTRVKQVLEFQELGKFWILAPAVEISEGKVSSVWFPATLGFILGALFIFVIDKLLPPLHPGSQLGEAEGIKTNLRRSILLVLDITLHNIPEGLAVEVAFGSLNLGLPSHTFAGAVTLMLGIEIQIFRKDLPYLCP